MKNLLLLLLFSLSYSFIYAAGKFWVGPQNGLWSDGLNWSLTRNGIGGAGKPGPSDAVQFSSDAVLRIDESSTISALFLNGSATVHVTLFTSTPTIITILNSMEIAYGSSLKDSTTASVPFNVIFSGATGATAYIYGDWIFEGGISLTSTNYGARFIAEEGSMVTVGIRPPLNQATPGGRIISRKNSGHIISSPSTLNFSYNSWYIVDKNLNAVIPDASWSHDFIEGVEYAGILTGSASTILLNGDIAKVQFLGDNFDYGRMLINLYDLSSDFNLGLPDKTNLSTTLRITNTNNHKVTLLASTGSSSGVTVEIGGQLNALVSASLEVLGDSTWVTLANATADAPATAYTLIVNRNYFQSGGHFSLQDYNNAAGSTVLKIKDYFIQNAGTFYTNSTSTHPDARFVVEMMSPNYIVGPSGQFTTSRRITASSGNIDNDQHMVTLRINHKIKSEPDGYTNGVYLQTPLQVGKLELLGSPLITTSVNMLTVNNPAPNAISVGSAGDSYVDGPMRRATNSLKPYLFPTGKGNTVLAEYVFDSCNIIPSSVNPSIYQVEYFKTGYLSRELTSPLKGISTTRYWDISKISGSDAQVQLTLNGSLAGAEGRDGVVVSHFVNGKWISENGSVLSPGNSAIGSVISKPLSVFSPVTLGYGALADLSTIPSNGLSYKFYRGTFDHLPDFSTLLPEKTGTTTNVDINVRPPGVDEGFAFLWEGNIYIPRAGTYTFETVSDDGSKLYFNSRYSGNNIALVDNDGTHADRSASGTIYVPAEGSYPVAITFFENNGGESMHVYWSGPGISRQAIPDAAFQPQPPGTGNGLTYKCYQGTFNTLPDFSILTPVKTGSSGNIDISVRPAGLNDGFAFMWEGYINIPAAGRYNFETMSDDGSRLYFNTAYSANAVALVNNDGLHPSQSASGFIDILAPGIYPIAITYMDYSGDEAMQLIWSGPGISRQIIPDSYFVTKALQPGVGLSYKFYEGNFTSLPDFSSLTPVKSGISTNVDISVRPAGVDNNFAFLWEGYINIPAPGNYTFETESDDGSRLYFNSFYGANFVPLVDNDGTRPSSLANGTFHIPAAGLYPIAISFFENTGIQSIKVFWTGPGLLRQQVPDAVFRPADFTQRSNGLQYQFYQGNFNSLPDFSKLTPAKTGISANADISNRPQAVTDHFAYLWQGYINIRVPGSYTFETVSDDGSKIYFDTPYSYNGTSLVDNDGNHPPRSVSGTVAIPVAGLYPIVVTFFEKEGGETMQMYWTGPGTERERIPDEVFIPSTPELPANGLHYKYYEGDYNTLPDFASLVPLKAGTSSNVDINVRPTGVNDHYAFLWEGYITIPTAGTYTFETISDDGSKIYFNVPYSENGISLVNNDGLHAPLSVTGTVSIPAAGVYPIAVTFFEKEGGETMQLYWSGPGIPRQRVPDMAFTTTLSNPGMIANQLQTLQSPGKMLAKPEPWNRSFSLYPNPFSKSFNVVFENVSAANLVSIEVYDLNGVLRNRYKAGYLPAGNNVLKITPDKRTAPGVYIVVLKINGIITTTQKILQSTQ